MRTKSTLSFLPPLNSKTALLVAYALGIDRTLMFVLVGVVVGAVGFLLRSFLHVLGSVRLDIFQTFATSGNSGGLLAVALGWGIFFTILAAALPAL